VTTFTAQPCQGGLKGRVRVPGDKSVSHRALLLATRAGGRSRLSGLSNGDDVLCTLRAMEQFGAGIRRGPDGLVTVDGGPDRLTEPESLIDVGNSGTAIRLLAGWATGVEGLTILAGDASIARRPMARVTQPLRLMGAHIDGRHQGQLPPLVIRGGGLKGIDYRLPVPSAQVKGALLLAGLAAEGQTTVREDLPTRAHTEEMLARCGAEITVAPGAVTVRPSSLQPFDLDIPGDPSQAAFWVVAACITPGSDLTIEHIYVGPGRAGFLDVLTRMGADLEILEKDGASSTATIRARYAPLAATGVGGEEIPALIDEIPVLAVAASYAAGTTTFADAAELRVKESDRIATMVAALLAVGAEAEERPDGLVVHGRAGRPLVGGAVDSAGDHRVAMALAVAALAASAPVTVSGWEAVATSYPGFEKDYNLCRS
jgi:3-phosphoshikimate 1-carboxyvinyltransferase